MKKSTTVLIVLGVVILGVVGYVAFNPGLLQAPVTGETAIEWRYTNAGDVDGMPHTRVTAVIGGTSYEVGEFVGSCTEVGESGGIDGKGLLPGELSATQCWFAGGGSEVGVFAHEDGGYQIMVGDLSEGEEGAGIFRGDFIIKTDIPG